MMQLRSLTASQRDAYHETVQGSHSRRVWLDLYRRSNSNHVTSFTDAFLGGSVQGDANREPVTVLECDVLDEDYALAWRNGEHRHFTVQVVDSRFVPELDEWVDEVVFTGPLWDFDRAGPVVHLIAEGPEMDAMGSVKKPDFWPAKTRATEVVNTLLTRAGAKRSQRIIPRLKADLPRDVTVGVRVGPDVNKDKKGKQQRKVQRLRVGRDDTYWAEAKPVAEAVDRDLYGDNRGRFVMERPPTKARRLPADVLLAPVTEKRADSGGEEQTNVWIIDGPNPKGPRKKIGARVSLPKKHPSSPHALRWNDEERQVIETVENNNLDSDKAARRLGERLRDRAARETVEHEVQLLPVIPWLRPGALVSVPVNAGRVSARVRRWTLPLGPGADPLTLGANRRRG